MTAPRHIGHILLSLILLTLVTASCSRDGEITCYEDITDPEGWYESDTIYLRPDTVTIAGTYQCDITIRTTVAYPYSNFSVLAKVEGSQERHTLHFNISESGTPYHEEQATLGQLSLQKGAAIVVAVKQNMRRETVPGIAAVGLRLVKVGE
jgi:gliding motility-associated lipoprotein GldH